MPSPLPFKWVMLTNLSSIFEGASLKLCHFSYIGKLVVAYLWTVDYNVELKDRSQKKKIMFLHSKNKASRKGYKGEC